MSIAGLTTFKQFIRELTNDLNNPLQLALDSATAEVNHFVGLNVETEFGSAIPQDIVTACCLLAQCHADAGDSVQNDARRVAAQRLLLPYRINTGIGGA